VASRRDFLTAFRKPIEKAQAKETLVVRPPYGKEEALFQSGCGACESKACESACEEKIIVIAADGTPILNFSQKGCTFCDACLEACSEGVLSVEHLHTQEQINARFIIGVEACVAHNGVICFSCKEPCIDDAILFNGLFNPVIDMNLCTGCGFCQSRCPTNAISYEAIAINQGEEI
jgi:ferredoxin-type protein NapF